MSAVATLRRGWCPGALRPMLTGDGLLARVRVSSGRLSLDQAEAIAQCAARFGNGIIEISSRANLQLRGIRTTELAELQKRLSSFGVLDPDETSEGVRNILASPIADIDPSAVLDTAPLVARLEACLAGDRDLRRLPAKFGFIIDGGGLLHLDEFASDVRFRASRAGPRAALEIALDGDAAAVARCEPEQIGEAASKLARAFLGEAEKFGHDVRRMRHLTAKLGAGAIFERAQLETVSPPIGKRSLVAPKAYLGQQQFGAAYCVGVAPALGRMRADDLAFLTRESRRLGARDIRLTPWRALIVTGLSPGAGAALAASARAANFITDPVDPLLAIVACAGAPACANAARDVRADALALAPNLPAGAGIVLHLSGCAKGCARATASPMTLVAQPTGYDLMNNGRAGDAPARRGLSLVEVASLLAREKGPN